MTKNVALCVCLLSLGGCATFSQDADKLSNGLVAVGNALLKVEQEYQVLCVAEPRVVPAKECAALKKVINDVVEGYSAVNAVVKAAQ